MKIYVFTHQKIHKNNNIKKNYHCSRKETASSSLVAGANQPSLPMCVSAPWLSSASSYYFMRSVRVLYMDESTARFKSRTSGSAYGRASMAAASARSASSRASSARFKSRTSGSACRRASMAAPSVRSASS